MEDPRQHLAFALQKYPQQVEAVPVDQLLIDSARQNPKRPAYLKMAVPDEWVKAIRGSREANDLLLVVRVPREVRDRADSRIVLPGEVE